MKTTFTHFIKNKWRALIPILFFSLFGLVEMTAKDCGVTIDDISIVIDCEGQMTIGIDSDVATSFSFRSITDDLTFESNPIVHATKIITSAAEFKLVVNCPEGASVIEDYDLPDFEALGAGTYTNVSGVWNDPTDVPSAGSIVMTSSRVNPTCPMGAPNDMDGSITITLNSTVAEKCEASLGNVTLSGGTLAAPVVINNVVIDGGTATFTGLGMGDYTASLEVPSPTCPCEFAPIADLTPIPLTGPTASTTSLACNSRINISVSESCNATVMATDILRGVSDPCDPMLAMIDSFVVKIGGFVIGGSGTAPLGFTIDDIRTAGPGESSLLGQQLQVEVIDEDSGNLCWGYVVFEDKTAPVVTCDNPSLMEISCLDYDGNIEKALRDQVIECSAWDPVIIAMSDLPEDCEDGIRLRKRVEVTYYAIDEFNNRSNTCTDVIEILRFDTIPGNDTLDAPGCINLPPNFILEPIGATTFMEQGNTIKRPADETPLACTQDYVKIPGTDAPAPIPLDEGGSGFPTMTYTDSDGNPATALLFPINYREASDFYKGVINDNLAGCNIGADFDDLIFNFGCKLKIQRQWYLREWNDCEGEQALPLGVQEIIVTDTEAPTFETTIEDKNFSVNADQCSRFYEIEMPDIADDCNVPRIEIAIYDADEAGNWNLIGPNIGANGRPQTSFEFPVGMSWIVYSALDDCGNERTDTTKVTVVDNTPPVVICKESLVIGNSGEGNVRLPATSIDNGTSDQCGPVEICVVRMDHLQLFRDLDDNGDGAVSLATFDAALQAMSDDGIACYRDYSATAIGKDQGLTPYLKEESLCTPYVDFCCNDLNTQGEDGIQVELRATDISGNTSACWSNITLQDKNEAIITCLPNITIDCGFPIPEFDRNYDSIADDPLSQYFGSIVSPGDQKAFGIPDRFVQLQGNQTFADLVDGTVFDDCSTPRISVINVGDIDKCGFGTISRTIFSHEGGVRKRVCRQVITIIRDEETFINSISFPDTLINLTGCMSPEDVLATSYGEPVVDEGVCSLIGISTENQLFTFNTLDDNSDACFKIVRTFRLIDWCKSTNGIPYEIGEPFRQVIKVTDPDGPEIRDCSDMPTTFTTNDCDGTMVELTATGFDECTKGADHVWRAIVQLDTDGDGELDTRIDEGNVVLVTSPSGMQTSTVSHKATYPLGTHRITWILSDQCGNIERCSETFVIENTKKPTPFAVDISTVLMNNTEGTVAVWADDLWAAGADPEKRLGPCGQTLMSKIVRSSIGDGREDGGFSVGDQSITFNCSDVGPDGVDINFFVYYESDAGNAIFDYTTVNVRVQDNDGICNSVTSAFITGEVTNVSREKMPNVSINLIGSENVGASAIDEVKTNNSGSYAFPPMPKGGAYKIDPTVSDDYLNGVSTLDLVLIQRHILGLKDLETSYDLIAADVNNDRKLSASDLVEVRSLILGYRSEFTNSESWRFIDEDYEFTSSNPLTEAFPENYVIDELAGNMNIDFIGLKVGDVNGTVSVSGLSAETRSTYNLSVADQSFAPSQLVGMEVSATRITEAIGLQMAIAFDESQLQFVGIDAEQVNLSSEHIGIDKVDEGLLVISWNDVEAIDINPEDLLFTVQFKAATSGKLSDAVYLATEQLNSEIYNESLEISNLGLEFENSVIETTYSLSQNTPNPFADHTQISFYLPKKTTATLTVRDVTGKVLRNITGSFDKGHNYITLSTAELNTSGVLFYTLETKEFTDTKRMVVLK